MKTIYTPEDLKLYRELSEQLWLHGLGSPKGQTAWWDLENLKNKYAGHSPAEDDQREAKR